jgi:hypothetical protein
MGRIRWILVPKTHVSDAIEFLGSRLPESVRRDKAARNACVGLGTEQETEAAL